MWVIRDAIINYQVREKCTCKSLDLLVPKYLTENKSDPWGIPYTILPEDGVIISAGPDRKMDPANPTDPVNRDNITVSYLPPFAICDAQQTVDLNNNGLLDNDDVITVFFSKTPTHPAAAAAGGADFVFKSLYDNTSTGEITFTCGNPDSSDRGRDANGPVNGDIGDLTVLEPEPGAGQGALNGKYDFVRLKVTRNKDVPFEAELFVRFADSAIKPPWSTQKYADKRQNLPLSAKFNVRVKKPGE
ncbi:MAG: hypothetical protein PHW04_14165 [Candidatus Wallbacteria bacterium]|nr:hypothetical protein [Candidatus Wallbacteria bacterium]